MNISETILSQLPKMKTSAELLEELMILPEYDEAIRWKDQADRLLGLQDIYRIYIPSQMSVEIYNKLILGLRKSSFCSFML